MAEPNLYFDFPGLNVKVGQEGVHLSSIILKDRTFATLPAAPVIYLMTIVSDSNTNLLGATIAGGGTNKVLAVYDGTNWKVMAGINGVTVPYA